MTAQQKLTVHEYIAFAKNIPLRLRTVQPQQQPEKFTLQFVACKTCLQLLSQPQN